MNKVETIKFACAEMAKYNLFQKGWTFEFIENHSRVGMCSYTKKTIYVSSYFLALTPDKEIQDTVLHEIAHALAGPKAKHGPDWKKVAKEVGARPQRTSVGAISSATPKYSGACMKGHTFVRNRKSPTATYYCPKCTREIGEKWHKDAAIAWKTNR